MTSTSRSSPPWAPVWEDGVKAVAALQKYRAEIDLVLLDIVMPEMDGFEVLTLMNQQGWIEDVPVIMLMRRMSAWVRG